MTKEQSLFEEDHSPTGGAGFQKLHPVTVENVIDILANRMVRDANGRDCGYWFNQIIINSALAEMPIKVVAEMVHNAAWKNDSSNKHARQYLESIIADLL